MLEVRLESTLDIFALLLFSSMKVVCRRDDRPGRTDDLKKPVRLIPEGVSISKNVETEGIQF